MQNKRKPNKGVAKRLFKYLFHTYPFALTIVGICILISSITNTSASLFIQKIIDNVINPGIKNGYSSVKSELYKLLIIMGSLYGLGIICDLIYTQIMAVVTQGFLKKMREDMFFKMESLPIKFFDTHAHGDVMSTYTNDVDAIRQLISQSIPQLITTIIGVSTIFIMMIYYSIWLSLIVWVSIIIMTYLTKRIGMGSAKFFMSQQKSLAICEGYIEEMMQGQKVVKVFCHEDESIENFKKLNEKLYSDGFEANKRANTLMPIMHNIGNILYVVVAIIGGIFIIKNTKNFNIFGFSVITTGIVVGFLQMSRQFANQVGRISQQINSVVMGFAGANRIFELLDQEPEYDDGYVTLVNANVDSEGNITESLERTGTWAWRHPHTDGTLTYTLLKGDIRLFDVDFGYNPEKIILHDVSIYAKPGQKIAFVGATGAGKTTITNLINRFYDIADGKIRYDGININKIKKSDLRKSIGIVLQDTNLFTGTVMDNIRYGKLDATDKEVFEAAKIANAYDFITRLPEGFNTKLSGNGSNLSQGQRQLLAIARAAVANAPVMILDEATSSIDTRTEALVQKGTDELMKGRTVFVIAHRLSTVQNANAIMVLDHGRIIERGDHDDLINQHGVYFQLYTGAFELE